MSNSSPDPRHSRRNGRFLRLPDAVFHASAPAERRAPAAVLERAIGGSDRPSASSSGPNATGTPPVREPLTDAPPVRERVFSGELRSVTGAVMRHRSSSAGASAKSRDRLVPPPPREKPWLRAGAGRRSRPAKPESGRRVKPWLKDSEADPTGIPAPGEGAPFLDDYREYVLIEDSEFSTLEAERQMIADAGWIRVSDEVESVAAVEPVAEEPSTEERIAADDPTAVPAEPAVDPQPIAETLRAGLISESDSDAVSEPSEPVQAAATTASPLTAVATTTTESNLTADAQPEHSDSFAEAPVDEHVEYLEDEPLCMDVQPEPFIQLPDFPETPAVFDVPAEAEPDQIATPPAEDDPEHIVELPENMLDPAGPYRDQFVPGIVVRYDVEYVSEAADPFACSPRMADPLAPGGGFAQEPAGESTAESATESAAEPVVVPVLEPAPAALDEPEAGSGPEVESKTTSAVPEVVAAPAPAAATAVESESEVSAITVVTREARSASSLNEFREEKLDELDGNDGESLKRELFQDIRRELHSDFSQEGLKPELDLDLDLDAQIKAGFDEEVQSSGESERTSVAQPATLDAQPARASETTQVDLLADEMKRESDSTDPDELLLADDELMAHLSIEVAPQFRVLSDEDAAAVRLRLEQARVGSAVPAAVSAAGLAETLQRIYTGERPTAEHFRGVLNVLQEKTRADALSVLVLDTEQMVYRPLLNVGLDARTAKNFYLSITDVRPDQHADFEVRRRANGELEDWQKRFSSAAFERLEGMYLIPIHRLGLPAYLAMIYSDLTRATEHVLTSMLPPILRELVPALHRFAMVEWRGAESERVGPQRTEDTSIVDHIYRLLNEVSNGGREKIEVLHLHFPALLQETAWRIRLDRMAAAFLDHMTMTERLVEATPERITLILKQTGSAEILRIAAAEAESNGLDLKTRVLRFPEHSRNLYNYISPGL